MKGPLRTLATLVLAALPVGAGQAQEPRRLETVYEVTVAGLAGLRVELKAQFGASGYEVESRAFKVGVLRALTPRYEGFSRAWGRLGDRDTPLAPTGGMLSIAASDQKRTWQVRYDASGTRQEMHDPPWHPSPAQAIDDKDRRGSLDPLTAILSVGMRGDAACEGTLASFDGRRRIDIVLRKIGSEPAARAGVPQASGEVLVCEARLRRVAGGFADDSGSSDSAERPVKLWFARLDSSLFRYPVRLDAQSALGLLRGRLLQVSEHPLMPKEKTAMVR